MSAPRHLLNILHASNASWVPSGFGAQTKLWLPALAKVGYGTVNFAYYGLQGAPLTDTDGILNLPQIREQFGNDIIQTYFNLAALYFPNHKATDIVWSLYDIFAMKADIWGVLPWAAQTPVDCEPILQHEMGQLAVCRWPVAMSRHGEKQMKNIGLNPLYVPHAIRTDFYTPMDRTAARQQLVDLNLLPRSISDENFLVIVVAANGIGRRKGFAEMFGAFQLFERDHPGALMYVHSEPNGVQGQPLANMIEQLGLTGKVFFPPSVVMVAGLVSEQVLRAVYCAGDVKLMLSYGEGFGVTDVQAQSCGTPIIATNFSASIELNFTGWKVNGALFQNEPLSYQMMPDIGEAASALGQAYYLWKEGHMPELRERTRAAAFVYDVQTVLHDYFIPALDQIGDDLAREPQAEWLKRRSREGILLQGPQVWAGMTVRERAADYSSVALTIAKGLPKTTRRERRKAAAAERRAR